MTIDAARSEADSARLRNEPPKEMPMKPNGSPPPAGSAIESPFLQAFAWEQPASVENLVATRMETPFLTAYAQEALLDGVNPEAEEVRSTLAELYDTEFDEALYELAHQGAAVAADAAGDGKSGHAEALLESWVAPLRMESEQLFENLSTAFSHTNLSTLAEDEIDRMVEEAARPGRPLEPVFDQFFKKLMKKAKSAVKRVGAVAKKGIALAKKLSPVHLLLGKLRRFVDPMLRKVLQLALNRLPPEVRPAASKLARHLLAPAGLEAEVQLEAEASADVGAIQRELDERVVNLMFAGEEPSAALLEHELGLEGEGSGWAVADPRRLDAAREAFIAEISQVQPHQAGPVVERFIPAMIPLLKLGTRLVGRQRLVSTLSGLVGQLIGRFVGKQATPALSRAIVDTGLKLMGLETADLEEEVGARALAATVEDVVRRVSEADDEVLEDTRLLEAEITDAFAQAAAAHFPQEFLNEDRRESSTAGGAWTLFPKGGFKKYSRTFDVELTPEMARGIQTFGGTALDAYLKDRLQLKLPLRARVHLYEAIPGTWFSRIARAEKSVAGLGPVRGAWQLFHPLTKQNAGALLREPGLGRDVSGKYLSRPQSIAVGQRFFYLEVPGLRPRLGGRTSRVDVIADFPKNELRVSVFLSEREAQAIAARLNSGGGVPSIVAALKETVGRGVRTALSGDVRGKVRIIHEAVDHEAFLGPALKRVGGIVLQRLSEKTTEWTLRAVADHLQANAAAFVSAAQDAADGVTVRVTLQSPPGFAVVRAALKGKAALPTSGLGQLFKGAPNASIRVAPGFAA